MSDIPINRHQRIIKRLMGQIEDQAEEIAHLKELVKAKDIPERVIDWMRCYDLFYVEFYLCPEHGKFCLELDTTFPYHFEGNLCEDCIK